MIPETARVYSFTNLFTKKTSLSNNVENITTAKTYVCTYVQRIFAEKINKINNALKKIDKRN